MKVLQVARHHWNYSIGGTELYVKDLVTGLMQKGVHSTILTFQDESRVQIDNDQRFPTIKLPKTTFKNKNEFIKKLRILLQKENYVCAHFHFFRNEEFLTAKILNELKIPYIFTYHLPAACCYRGNLMRWGTEVCSSEVGLFKCTACRIQNRMKVNATTSYLVTILYSVFSRLLFVFGKKIREQLDYWKTTGEYVSRVRYFLSNASLGISCSEWGIDTLKLNGVRSEKVVYVPQGLPLEFTGTQEICSYEDRNRMTIGYVGRISQEKGVDLLIDAFKKVKSRDARLEIYGLRSPSDRSLFEENICKKIKTDSRISIHSRLNRAELAGVYKRIGYLAVPSICPETGPLVIWEALTFGVPVLASERIGHKKLLENGKKGILVAPNTCERWTEIIENALLGDNKFTKTDNTIRTMNDIVDEMVNVYLSFNDPYDLKNSKINNYQLPISKK